MTYDATIGRRRASGGSLVAPPPSPPPLLGRAPRRAAAGMFSIRWQTIDPTGTVVASSVVTQAFAGLAAGVQATPVYTAAWGDGRWRDGPYRVVVQADVTNAVNEGTFENK